MSTETPIGAATGQAAPAAAPAQERVVVHDAGAEAARAIQEARNVLATASAEIASDDADRLAHGYELAAGCADHIARALWFLRRAERERQG